MSRSLVRTLVAAALLLSGCGYTTRSNLPEDVRSVHVTPVKNAIDLSAEVSDKTPFRVYRPGLEVELTNAIINRFIFDGTLKVATADKTDTVLEASLIDYRRDALRYDEGDSVQEYRLSISVAARLVRKSDGKALWEKNIVGDSTFFLAGGRAITEDQASSKAVEDAARRVVEATIEYW